MKLVTKYEVGDKLYMVYDNKAIKVTVVGITVYVVAGDSPGFISSSSNYTVMGEDRSIGKLTATELDLFRTQVDLVEFVLSALGDEAMRITDASTVFPGNCLQFPSTETLNPPVQ